MIKIKSNHGRIFVDSPYDRDFINGVKQIQGKWDGSHWSVPAENQKELRRLLLDVYKYDPYESKEIVKIKFKALDFEDYARGKIFIGPIKVAWRKSRDYPVDLYGSAKLTEGEFEKSGGSVNNPAVEANGTEIIVMTIPKQIFDNLSEKERAKIEILDTSIDLQALKDEKKELLKRIAEIDAIIADNSKQNIEEEKSHKKREGITGPIYDDDSNPTFYDEYMNEI